MSTVQALSPSWRQRFFRVVAADARGDAETKAAELAALIDLAADPANARRMMQHADHMAQHAPEAFWAAQLTLAGLPA